MPGVYLSFPFCPHKCTFCNFASGVHGAPLQQRYEAALLAEITAHPWAWQPATVYLGGGTPSNMDSDALARILSRIPGHPWREATLEGLPGTLTPERVQGWRGAGINRVSLGVQSFVPNEVSRTGRRHAAEEVAADVELLRTQGIENICLDLIAGLPGMAAESWDVSLDWIERLRVPHVSVYLLEVDEKSRLGQEYLRGGTRYGAKSIPADDTAAQLFSHAVTRLERMGLRHYEISNFAQPGFESVHNSKYWRLEPYIGFGADAHSFDGTWRWSNPADLLRYCTAAEAGGSPALERIPAQLAEERIFLGLRLREGVALSEAERQAHATAIAQFSQAGLVEWDGPCLRLTERGVLLSNEVFQEFIGEPLSA